MNKLFMVINVITYSKVSNNVVLRFVVRYMFMDKFSYCKDQI